MTSDISSELRTRSLKIIRKIIESENKSKDSGTRPSAEWETEDWEAYSIQIKERQDMLNELKVVDLLCRIIEKETKR